jgi:hypothetical protein
MSVHDVMFKTAEIATNLREIVQKLDSRNLTALVAFGQLDQSQVEGTAEILEHNDLYRLCLPDEAMDEANVYTYDPDNHFVEVRLWNEHGSTDFTLKSDVQRIEHGWFVKIYDLRVL